MSIPGNANPLLLASAAADAAAAGPIKSLRFNAGDTAYLNRTPSSAGNRKTFTFACWFKLVETSGTRRYLFSASSANTGSPYNWILGFAVLNGQLCYTNAANDIYKTDAVLRDFSAWYHCVFAVDTTQAATSDRVKIYLNGALMDITDQNHGGADPPSQNTEYPINNTTAHAVGAVWNHQNTDLSGYFNGLIADAYLIDGSALDPTSFGAYDDNGVWQAAAYSGTYGTNGFHLLDFENESTVGHDSSGNDNDFTANNLTTTAPVTYSSNGSITNNDGRTDQVGSFAAVFNGTQSAESSHAYGFLTGTFDFTWNLSTAISYSNKVEVWTGFGNGAAYLNGGSAVSSNNNNWTTLVSGSSGTITSIRFTTSGNGGWWAGVRVDDSVLVNGDPADLDVLFDVPTNGTQSDTGAGGEVSGNYATWNPLSSATTLSNGNLDSNGTGGHNQCLATIGMSSGKWYFETTIVDNTENQGVGIALKPEPGTFIGNTTSGYLYYGNGTKRHNTTNTVVADSFTDGDVIGIAFDADGGNLYFYKNGVAQISGSAAFTGLTSGPYFFTVDQYDTSAEIASNFGQRAFAYSAPSGFKALCTTNLPTATVADGSDYFDIKLYNGNSGTQAISGYGFSPDWVVVKSRSSGQGFANFDVLRGVSNALFWNNTLTETGQYQQLSSFDSNGFTLTSGTDGSYPNEGNLSGDNYVGYAWDAGSSTVSNTDGNITSSVRANQTAGMSIVTWTAAAPGTSTIGHGLSDVPTFVITKSRTTGNHWAIFHKDLGQSKLLRFNNSAVLSVSDYWGSSSDWTSSTFCVRATTNSDNNIGDMVAYCFAPVAGFSHFTSFEGTGSSDPVFVHCGFRPAWIMKKNIDTGSTNWYIHDTARDTFNVCDAELKPNSGAAENTFTALDILSNGFAMRTSNSNHNGSGDTYIVAAFAENPFQANGGLAR